MDIVQLVCLLLSRDDARARLNATRPCNPAVHRKVPAQTTREMVQKELGRTRRLDRPLQIGTRRSKNGFVAERSQVETPGHGSEENGAEQEGDDTQKDQGHRANQHERGSRRRLLGTHAPAEFQRATLDGESLGE